nr:transposase [Ensifer aridi]
MTEAVAERLQGAPRQLRRRWSDEFKAQVVAEALEPSDRHSCRLFAWRRDARNDAPRSIWLAKWPPQLLQRR